LKDVIAAATRAYLELVRSKDSTHKGDKA
jgi:hypothetical protein